MTPGQRLTAAAVLLLAPAMAAAQALHYVVEGDGIPEPLAEVAADAAAGRAVFLDRERGHCLLCHRLASLDAPSQGNLGPDLSAIGARLTAAQLRLRLVDAERVNGATAMPSYHRLHGLRQVHPDFAGEPVLTAAEVEHLLAFLLTLTEP